MEDFKKTRNAEAVNCKYSSSKWNHKFYYGSLTEKESLI